MKTFSTRPLFFLATMVAGSMAFTVTTKSAVRSGVSMLWESAATTEGLQLTLEKPLGMILEEVEEGQPLGVVISELAEGGSAEQSEYKDKLVGLQVISVMGQATTALSFDDVMDLLIDAPSPVSLEVASLGAESADSASSEDAFPIGTVVPITVVNKDGSETTFDGKVGDNLRSTLLENNVEVYIGMKQKLGNCGGGGQCTFCAGDFLESEGWEPRSDYENQKLKNAPATVRITCMNNIQGPVKLKMV